jgi:DNA polymerase III epsilon subunit-like protein
MDPIDVVGPLTGARFAVVDVETTGLRPDEHHILQIAVVITDVTGVELDTWSTYVRPARWPWMRVGPKEVHGISRRRIARAPSTVAALTELSARVGDAAIVAHNLEFDLGFLQREAEAAGVTLPAGPRWCTLTLSRSLDRSGSRSHKLVDLCSRYGVALDRPHDALEDARATAAIIPGLLREADISTWEQLLARATPRVSRRRRPD